MEAVAPIISAALSWSSGRMPDTPPKRPRPPMPPMPPVRAATAAAAASAEAVAKAEGSCGAVTAAPMPSELSGLVWRVHRQQVGFPCSSSSGIAARETRKGSPCLV